MAVVVRSHNWPVWNQIQVATKFLLTGRADPLTHGIHVSQPKYTFGHCYGYELLDSQSLTICHLRNPAANRVRYGKLNIGHRKKMDFGAGWRRLPQSFYAVAIF